MDEDKARETIELRDADKVGLPPDEDELADQKKDGVDRHSKLP